MGSLPPDCFCKAQRTKSDQAWSQWAVKAIAVAQLNQFFFAGDFTNLALEISRLAKRLTPFGFACRELDVPWERQSTGKPFSSAEEEQKIRVELAEISSIDQEIYSHFFPKQNCKKPTGQGTQKF